MLELVASHFRSWQNSTFQQDIERLQSFGVVRNYFNRKNIRMLTWFSCFLYLSAIGNIRSMFAERLSGRLTPIITIGDLYLLEAAYAPVPFNSI